MSITSKHAWDRMHQRVDIPRASRKQFAYMAWTTGSPVGESEGKVVKEYNGYRCIFAEVKGQRIPKMVTLYKPTPEQVEDGL